MNLNIENDYERKLNNFMISEIKHLKNFNILEFGVNKGISTKMFLELCNTNNGKLYSVDVDDYSNLFFDKNWKFIHCRDDNFQKVESSIPEKLDLIYLDSYHEPNHVQKIFMHYYPMLKTNGFYIIDDVCWLPYVKKNYRDDFGSEIAHYNTFFKILNIYNSNFKNFDLDFTFVGSGLAKISKKNNNKLNEPKVVISRNFTIKNFIRKIIKKTF